MAITGLCVCDGCGAWDMMVAAVVVMVWDMLTEGEVGMD